MLWLTVLASAMPRICSSTRSSLSLLGNSSGLLDRMLPGMVSMHQGIGGFGADGSSMAAISARRGPMWRAMNSSCDSSGAAASIGLRVSVM
jgi:hypothetical protein